MIFFLRFFNNGFMPADPRHPTYTSRGREEMAIIIIGFIAVSIFISSVDWAPPLKWTAGGAGVLTVIGLTYAYHKCRTGRVAARRQAMEIEFRENMEQERERQIRRMKAQARQDG